jgi:hypothetical protein
MQGLEVKGIKGVRDRLCRYVFSSGNTHAIT